MEMVLDEATIALFQGKDPVGRAYSVAMQEGEIEMGDMVSLDRRNLAQYKTVGNVSGHLAFAPPNLDARLWEFNGSPSEGGGGGFRGIFRGQGQLGELRYTRWTTFLLGYVVSGVSGLVIIMLLAIASRDKWLQPLGSYLRR